MKGENNMEFEYNVWYVNKECKARLVYQGNNKHGALGPFRFLKYHLNATELVYLEVRSVSAIGKGKKHAMVSYYQHDPMICDELSREFKFW